VITDCHIVLDTPAALWTQGLAKSRGGSRHLRFHDPFFEEPLYQQAYGLHKALCTGGGMIINSGQLMMGIFIQ
jgi:hypothetical protein